MEVRASVRNALLGLAALAMLASPAAPQTEFFADREDEHWSRFQKGKCTLIEGVPIVPQAPKVQPVDAAISSVLGFYEATLPLVGPAQPGRLDRLVAATPIGRPLDAQEQQTLAERLDEIQQQTWQTFLTAARANPNQTDGMVRSHVVTKLGGPTPSAVLRKIAADRLQAVTIDTLTLTSQTVGGLAGFLTGAVDKKAPTLLIVDGGKATFVGVGYGAGGELLIVVDPQSAKARLVPGDEAFMSESDRKSSDAWAQEARKTYARRRVPVDEITSCKGSRPAGLRFLLPYRLVNRTEIHAVRDWGLDAARIRVLLQQGR
jgi:hypothetical protein